MYSPRIKICGIARLKDAEAALRAGVDAIGLVFYKASPRAVEIEAAREIAQCVGPFVSVTALFVNPLAEDVEAVLKTVPVSLLQFHGDELADFCRQFQRPWIKACRVKPELNLSDIFQQYDEASALLLDTYKDGLAGGTGETFDWGLVANDRLPRTAHQKVILAGGLTPENVGQAVSMVRPYAVDVSGGVEVAPGIKDADKMLSFVRAVRETSNC
jgi:phosphoribosylanthranilate isomerase